MSLPLRHVLLVQGREDDSIRVRNLLMHMTTAAREVEWVSTYDTAYRALTQGRYDVCLLDYDLDARTGLDLLQDVPTGNPTPIIFLVVGENQVIEAAAVSAGAVDFLLKDQLTTPLLERSIRYAIERFQREAMLSEYAATLEGERRQSHLLSIAVENFTDGLLITDAQRDDNPIIFANRAFSTLTGYTSEEILGWSCRFLQGEATDPQTVQQMREAIKEQRPFKGVVRNYRQDGTPFWNGLKIAPVFDADGQLINFVGLQADVTERHQVGIALQESEASLARAQQITRLGSWELDLSNLSDINSNPLRWSDETFRLFGYEPGEIEITNENFFRSVHPDDRDRVAAAMAMALRGEQPYNLDHRVIWPDGTERVIHGQADLIHDKVSGAPLKMVGTGQDITERKQAEASAFETQQRLTLATESARIGVWDWDVVADKLVWDAQLYALYGIREQDFGGAYDAWTNGLHPEDRERAEADINAALEGSRDFDTQFRVLWPTGEVRHIEAHGMVQRAENGTALRMVGVNWDVTERQRAEESLRESEERFHTIVANVPGMVYQYVWNPDGSIEIPFVNEGCREIFEVEPEELRRNPSLMTDVIHPDDRAKSGQSAAESAQNLTPWRWEGRLKLPSGKTSWVRGIARSQRLPDGGTLWNGLLTDITARKEAEAERDRFFTLSLDMLAIVSSDGYFQRLNPAFEAMLGFSNAELMAVPFLEFVHPDDIDATLAKMAKLNSGVQVMSFENRYRCRDGSYKWLRWMSAPFEELWYCVAHDITETRQAAAALQKANDELELHVLERTAELGAANEALRIENIEHQMTMAALRQAADAFQRAKEEADRANAAKSEFLARMSHELRTPLNAILGFGQILEMQSLPPRSKDGVGHILKGGRHLLGLINEVLDISRVEAGHSEMSIEPVALEDVLSEACLLVGPLAAQRNIRLDHGSRGRPCPG